MSSRTRGCLWRAFTSLKLKRQEKRRCLISFKLSEPRARLLVRGRFPGRRNAWLRVQERKHPQRQQPLSLPRCRPRNQRSVVLRTNNIAPSGKYILKLFGRKCFSLLIPCLTHDNGSCVGLYVFCSEF
ncbi:60S ribosomal protein L19-3 [Iris pallida]|uniref:60S ribosomal protein L19-3 n=1 Tax=Iris pallida TaxID=29817 RepID=A0AAX6F3J3_IRIPA|nr:60S ribosomal protein L19-3 [Iris pallida]